MEVLKPQIYLCEMTEINTGKTIKTWLDYNELMLAKTKYNHKYEIKILEQKNK